MANNKKRSFYTNFKIMLLFLGLIVVGLIVFLYVVIMPIITDYSTARVKSLTMSSINSAVYETLSENYDYASLISVLTDNAGRITLIQANSSKINSLARETARLSQERINELGDVGVNITIGTLTGSPFFQGKGPDVILKLQPIGSVSASFISEFEDAGINQTRHRIYMEVKAVIDVILPVTKTRVESITQVLIAENILVGEVPSTYLRLDDLKSLNFLP